MTNYLSIFLSKPFNNKVQDIIGATAYNTISKRINKYEESLLSGNKNELVHNKIELLSKQFIPINDIDEFFEFFIKYFKILESNNYVNYMKELKDKNKSVSEDNRTEEDKLIKPKRKLLKDDEDIVEEDGMSMSGNAGAYNTPKAFGKISNRVTNAGGMTPVKYNKKNIKTFDVMTSKGKLREAAHIDQAWAKKELKSFNQRHQNTEPDNEDFDNLAEIIIKHLGYKSNSNNINKVSDHLSIIWAEEENFPSDMPMDEIYDLLENNLNEATQSETYYTNLRSKIQSAKDVNAIINIMAGRFTGQVPEFKLRYKSKYNKLHHNNLAKVKQDAIKELNADEHNYDTIQMEESVRIKNIIKSLIKEVIGAVAKDSLPMPKIGSYIYVYRTDENDSSAVKMKVIERDKFNSNLIMCDYDGMEYAVKVRKLEDGTLGWAGTSC